MFSGWQALQLVHWYGGNPTAALDAELNVVRLTDPQADPYGAAFAYAVAAGTSSIIGRTEGPEWLAESARIAAPLRNPTLHMWETFMAASLAYGEDRLEDALAGFREAASVASACEVPVWERRALAIQVPIATRLGHTDLRGICYDVFARLDSTDSWGDIYSTLETAVLEMWTAEGRVLDAGIILGFLEANDLHHTLATDARARAAEIIHAHRDGEQAVQRGRTMDREQLVGYVMERLSPSG